ncbi:MAG TPA: outer membrane beta-barrel protein, partial [Acidobacteriaceae bacterium]|nr:outer membrane beta-barrel protein [Acidobacteriaceae bacterium]
MIRLWGEVLTLFTIYHTRTRYVSIAMAAVLTFAVIPLGTLGQARESDSGDPQQQIRELRALVIALQHRLEKLENPKAPADRDAISTPAGDSAVALDSASQELKSNVAPTFTKEDRATLDFLNGTTLNVGIDGYYQYNFNAPIGRVNLLRAYDVTSNSFNINQASLIIEHAANPLAGQRYGARIDLQYGQATETLQGGAQNELRPQVWR